MSGEWNDSLSCDDIFKEFAGLVSGHSLNVVGDFPAVLVVYTEVRSPRLGVGHSRIGFDGIARHGEGIVVEMEVTGLTAIGVTGEKVFPLTSLLENVLFIPM